MKHINKYTKFFGWMAVAILLLATSCKDDLFEGSNGLSDEVTVSFTLTPEAAATVATRDVKYPEEGKYPHISDGSKADMLIYAVYDEKDSLLTGYGETDGQTIIRDIKEFPITINLTLKRGETYKIAFWAQSSKCNAYNTSDLKKVEVIYGEIDNTTDDDTTGGTSSAAEAKTTTPNNDEFRDAFCRSVEIVAGQTDKHNIYLYRPLAQINVGTNGYDFESITRHAQKKYLYSKIRLNRVARYLDVVNDKTYSSTTDDQDPYGSNKTAEAFAVVDFGYARIPAYTNYKNGASDANDTTLVDYPILDFPDFPSYTKWDWINDSNFSLTGYTEKNYEAEEFLKVHLYENRDASKDETWIKDDDGSYRVYANLNNYGDKDYQTETFKYLSMCYVLTSSTKEEKITINNVKMWLATDEDGKDSVEVVNLNNVPAQRNWRTNIIGNLLTTDQTFSVTLDRDFAGEYNGWGDEDGKWENLSGPLAEGVYYDAANDEIQISNANGLLWFQRMVNGDLRVRYQKDSKTKGYYPYLVEADEVDKDGKPIEKTLYLKYDGIDGDKLDPIIKQRILQATHQDQNTNSGKGWPANKNFHFCGSNGPAKVKLMADIDLTGIEWIPIGYDFKVHDTSAGKDDFYLNFKESDANQRAFCGIFDGNGHTISNLSSKRFSAKVHQEAEQKSSDGPYDNIQWMPAGFFGLVGGWKNNPAVTDSVTTIKNLRLLNVDIYGYHTAGGIAAIVNSKDSKVVIDNCMVDGGFIELSPMFRGDTHNATATTPKSRTFARGIYGGGIVGQWVANGELTNCQVNNLMLRAYRRIGGLVGSVSNSEQDTYKSEVNSLNLAIKDNKIHNLLIIADKFQPYDTICNKVENNVWKNGFGWKAEQASYAHYYVGGDATDKYESGYNNTGKETSKLVEFKTGANDGSTKRTASIGEVPLQYIPMLSSWFCDEITLNSNYYGKPSVHIDRNYTEFEVYSIRPKEIYSVPFRLPYDLSVDYDKTSPYAAMYVESVTLDGKGSIGGRSVITPEGVSGDSACVMYVTSRNRKQFTSNAVDSNNKKTTVDDDNWKKSTIIRNVVLRGSPYAWAGIILDPNENVKDVQLKNVFIYDVYQTLAQREQKNATPWYKDVSVPLKVEDCNFRGYTAPGKGWSKITYNEVTFEQGTSTGHTSEERVCKVEAPTDFRNCKFKAPYRIDLSAMTDLTKVTFKDEKGENKCYATSTSTRNVEIDLTGKKGCTRIRIDSDEQGHPIVKYLDADGHEIY